MKISAVSSPGHPSTTHEKVGAMAAQPAPGFLMDGYPSITDPIHTRLYLDPIHNFEAICTVGCYFFLYQFDHHLR
jgi:hypothetical protein